MKQDSRVLGMENRIGQDTRCSLPPVPKEGPKYFLKGLRCFYGEVRDRERNFVAGAVNGQSLRPKVAGIPASLRRRHRSRALTVAGTEFPIFLRRPRVPRVRRAKLDIMLERRLDNVVWRSGLRLRVHRPGNSCCSGPCPYHGKKVNIPSYHCDVGGGIASRIRCSERHGCSSA